MRISYTNQCRRDYKKARRQGRDINKFKKVITKLSKKEKLPAKHKDHKLSGRWGKHRECHIASDWLLIYRVSGNTLFIERLGTHSELFK